MKRSDEAFNLYESNFNCCQSILGAFGPDWGLDKTSALKMGSGFSAGVAYQGETCGAVTGACMIIGLINGSDNPNNDYAEQLTYAGIKEFLSEFKKKFGTTNCSQLLETDISTAEGFRFAQESGLFRQLCPKFVREAAIILEKLLQKNPATNPSLGYFNELASGWDKMREMFFPEKIREDAISKAQLGEGSVVVDLGAGSGFITEGLADQPIRIIAIDQSHAMLDIMKKKFAGKQNIEYRQGTSDNLPVDANSIDAVFANMYLHHTEDPSKAIKEVFRILKPRGQFMLIDLNRHDHQFLVDEQFDIWKGFDGCQIKTWMNTAGFNKLELTNLNELCCASSTNTTDKARVEIFLGCAVKE